MRRPGVERIVEHQPAADKEAHVEVEKIARLVLVAEHKLGAAGGGGVIAEENRERAMSGKLRRYV